MRNTNICHGICIAYHGQTTGAIQAIYRYKNDVLHGKITCFFPDGQIEQFGYYKNGVMSDDWRSFAFDVRGEYFLPKLKGSVKIYRIEGRFRDTFWIRQGSNWVEIENPENGKTVWKMVTTPREKKQGFGGAWQLEWRDRDFYQT